MAKFYITQGLTQQEYNEVSEKIKAEFPFRVSVSRNKSPKRAYGSFNIKPVKKDGKFTTFNQQQAEFIINFLKSNGFVTYGMEEGFDLCVYWQHVSYIFKKVG